jgi:hypothetical protein
VTLEVVCAGQAARIREERRRRDVVGGTGLPSPRRSKAFVVMSADVTVSLDARPPVSWTLERQSVVVEPPEG